MSLITDLHRSFSHCSRAFSVCLSPSSCQLLLHWSELKGRKQGSSLSVSLYFGEDNDRNIAGCTDHQHVRHLLGVNDVDNWKFTHLSLNFLFHYLKSLVLEKHNLGKKSSLGSIVLTEYDVLSCRTKLCSSCYCLLLGHFNYAAILPQIAVEPIRQTEWKYCTGNSESYQQQFVSNIVEKDTLDYLLEKQLMITTFEIIYSCRILRAHSTPSSLLKVTGHRRGVATVQEDQLLQRTYNTENKFGSSKLHWLHSYCFSEVGLRKSLFQSLEGLLLLIKGRWEL